MHLPGSLVVHLLEPRVPSLQALLPVLLHLVGSLLLLVPLGLLELPDLDEGRLEFKHGRKLYLEVGFLDDAQGIKVTREVVLVVQA